MLGPLLPPATSFATCDRCGHRQEFSDLDADEMSLRAREKVMRAAGWRISPYNRAQTRSQAWDEEDNEVDGDLCPRCNEEAT